MVKERQRKVIVAVNRKGGVAKTTTCGYVAAVLHEAGLRVTGVDTDPEKGWMKWFNTGALPYTVVAADHESLLKTVRGIEGYVVIDTPPNDGEIITKACLIADEVIIPVAATGHDMSRLQSTLAAVEDIETHRDKDLASVVLTRYKSGLAINREVIAAMGERKIPVAKTKIRHLTRYESFTSPVYLDEYRQLLSEIGVL